MVHEWEFNTRKDRIVRIADSALPEMWGLFYYSQFVFTELSRIHENFVIVPADKASNNYTCTTICKKYYVDILMVPLTSFTRQLN